MLKDIQLSPASQSNIGSDLRFTIGYINLFLNLNYLLTRIEIQLI